MRCWGGNSYGQLGDGSTEMRTGPPDTDVLTGAYKPTGKLGFSWPRSNDQLPLGTGTNVDVLYKIGYGLKY